MLQKLQTHVATHDATSVLQNCKKLPALRVKVRIPSEDMPGNKNMFALGIRRYRSSRDISFYDFFLDKLLTNFGGESEFREGM